MNARLVEQIASTILYEGYVLYPYRPSALKNQQRFNFGVVMPPSAAARGEGVSELETQVLVNASGESRIDIRARCLHLTASERGPAAWQEAIERIESVEASLDTLCTSTVQHAFSWPAGESGARTQDRVDGSLTVSADRADVEVPAYKVTIHIANTTPPSDDDHDRGAALRRALVSTHALLHVPNGEFLSLLDPRPGTEALVADCRNTGLWPVLIGEPGAKDAMLAAPIILYDYPQIAAESAADFFDGTEIDEMLVLRILTLTDREKQEMRLGDTRASRLLEETERLSPERLMQLHGVLRGLSAARKDVTS